MIGRCVVFEVVPYFFNVSPQFFDGSAILDNISHWLYLFYNCLAIKSHFTIFFKPVSLFQFIIYNNLVVVFLLYKLIAFKYCFQVLLIYLPATSQLFVWLKLNQILRSRWKKMGTLYVSHQLNSTTLPEHAQILPKTVYRALRTFSNLYPCKLEMHICQPGTAHDLSLGILFTWNIFALLLLCCYAVFLWRNHFQYSVFWQSAPCNM